VTSESEHEDFRLTGEVAQSVETLQSQMSRGEVILFTGAGFSMDAKATDGQNVPSARALTKILWPAAFPGGSFDPGSQLGDVFEVALQASRTNVAETLRSCLTVDATSLPDFYRSWFTMPWYRMYTLNIDDLELAAQRAFDLPVSISTVSAKRDSIPRRDYGLECVHLNGDLQDVPNVTFSAPAYGGRIPGTDPWYSALTSELMSHPVVFVGTELNESPLWQHIALRGDRVGLERELRPRSYLVSPTLPPARRALLRQYNVEHIPMDAADFARRILSGMAEASAQGHSVLASRRAITRGDSPLALVGDLRKKRPTVSLADFLLGREPVWADLTDGHAIVREFEAQLVARPSFFDPTVVFLLGTAGSGKTTTLMRLALEAHAKGRKVAWLDLVSGSSIPSLKRQIFELSPDVLFVDDVDSFAGHAAGFIKEITARSPDMTVVASSRSTRADRFELVESLSKLDAAIHHIPHLTDSDIHALLDALDNANRLGALKGKPFPERVEALRTNASRQLIVALIEATSGRRFDDMIDSECRELKSEHVLIYSILAVATRARTWLTLDEILLAAGGSHTANVSCFDALRRQHLVVEVESGKFYVRHRVVAERVVAHLRREQSLAPAIEGLLYAFATRRTDAPMRSSRQGRLLIRLLNHQSMIDEVGDPGRIRQIYDHIEAVMAQDYHFWLQRGSFEVERGDLERAENYLNQAKGIAPDDGYVQTEWGYMQLKRATVDAGSGISGWRERAEEAMLELQDVISRSGAHNAHPFHVVGSQGVKYSRAARFGDTEREAFLLQLRATVDKGLKLHKGNDDLLKLSKDLDQEYMMLATRESGE
jgi:tetratricopeptide (TPR) repeat protein